jgi:hypothetical protein
MAINFLKYLIPGNLGSVSEDISEKRPSLFWRVRMSCLIYIFNWDFPDIAEEKEGI